MCNVPYETDKAPSNAIRTNYVAFQVKALSKGPNWTISQLDLFTCKPSQSPTMERYSYFKQYSCIQIYDDKKYLSQAYYVHDKAVGGRCVYRSISLVFMMQHTSHQIA